YRYGFGSFSYRLEGGAAAQPVPIRLRRGTVETGKVVDADTGQPIAGAEVAFEQTGRSDPWADWDRRMWHGPGGGMRWEEATRTDQNGRFRVVALNIVGLAARHPGYRDADDKEFRWVNPDDPRPRDLPGEIVLKMHPLRLLRGRVVDRDGTPIGGARIGRTANAGTSDGQGRFTVEVTSEEWRDRDHRRISLVAVDHRAILVPLSDFAFERETVFVLPLTPENSVTITGDLGAGRAGADNRPGAVCARSGGATGNPFPRRRRLAGRTVFGRGAGCPSGRRLKVPCVGEMGVGGCSYWPSIRSTGTVAAPALRRLGRRGFLDGGTG
ncbi:MAG: hypothetical protein U1E05_04055, partial [Patescibacteria group bacterium]|nr:hypothetical protein [Patescibacteria group bacterium]